MWIRFDNWCELIFIFRLYLCLCICEYKTNWKERWRQLYKHLIIYIIINIHISKASKIKRNHNCVTRGWFDMVKNLFLNVIQNNKPPLSPTSISNQFESIFYSLTNQRNFWYHTDFGAMQWEFSVTARINWLCIESRLYFANHLWFWK